jgi:hypothetical protein
MTDMSSVPHAPVTAQPSRAEWTVSAAVSGAVFAVLGAAVFAILFGITTVLDTGPDSAGEGSGLSVGDTVVAALYVSGFALLIGGAIAAPTGALLGLLNGGLARAVPTRFARLSVVVTSVLVGLVCAVLLPVPVTRTLDLNLFGASLGGIAAVTAGVHLHREQKKVARRQVVGVPVDRSRP